MKQLKVAFPDELRRALEAAAAESGRRSLADEIRARVEQTFRQESDPTTKHLIDAILSMVDEIRAEAGPISFTQKPGCTVLTAAISAWLEANESAVAANVGEPLNFCPDDAGALGRSIARRYVRRQREVAEGRRHFREFLEKRGKS